VIVDGANVVGARPDGWWRDRAGAARRLYERLVAMQEAAHAAEPDGREVVLVLEGKARQGVPEGEGLVVVVHAPGEGDDEIVRQSVEADLVVTADRELRRRVAPVVGVGPSWVWDA
jgi:hypothetical protein